tara:strand:+ start:251 stop:670 length:420 start_codon:yes stop_codon:yes gene_type:complete
MYIIGSLSPLNRVDQRSTQIYNLTDKDIYMKTNTHKVQVKNTIFYKREKTCFYGSVEEAKKLPKDKNRYIIILCDKPNQTDLEGLLKLGCVFHHKHLYQVKGDIIIDQNTFTQYDLKTGGTNFKHKPQEPKNEDVSKSS